MTARSQAGHCRDMRVRTGWVGTPILYTGPSRKPFTAPSATQIGKHRKPRRLLSAKSDPDGSLGVSPRKADRSMSIAPPDAQASPQPSKAAADASFGAFVSYSGEANRHVVDRLQNRIERLAKPWYRSPIVKVF